MAVHCPAKLTGELSHSEILNEKRKDESMLGLLTMDDQEVKETNAWKTNQHEMNVVLKKLIQHKFWHEDQTSTTDFLRGRTPW